jgi:hypothetical protein
VIPILSTLWRLIGPLPALTRPRYAAAAAAGFALVEEAQCVDRPDSSSCGGGGRQYPADSLLHRA